jgi:DNA polymerase I-like protein with 3'-5' exonuclease and polymerase domains
VQVHDALKFEVAEGLQDTLNKEMTHAMTKVPTQLKVPLGVDGKWGRDFASMGKFK